MKFIVIWQKKALDELADLWNKAADRNAVVRASDEIDDLLSDIETDTGDYQSFNIGTGRATSVKKIAQLLAKGLGKDIQPVLVGKYREGDIRQSEEIGTAMLALRTFMFEQVYLAEAARSEHARARATVRRIFEHLVERGDPVDDVIDYVAGMTDRFALSYAESLD